MNLIKKKKQIIMQNVFFFGQTSILPFNYFLNINPTSVTNNTGLQSTHQIDVTSNTTWVATPSLSWIIINTGGTGTGNGTTNFTLTQNNTGNPRSGTINYTGTGVDLPSQVSITQSPIDLQVTPQSINVPGNGDTYNILVTASTSITWSTSISYTGGSGWITINTGGTGTGNGTTSIIVDPNGTGIFRSANINYIVNSLIIDTVLITQDFGQPE